MIPAELQGSTEFFKQLFKHVGLDNFKVEIEQHRDLGGRIFSIVLHRQFAEEIDGRAEPMNKIKEIADSISFEISESPAVYEAKAELIKDIVELQTKLNAAEKLIKELEPFKIYYDLEKEMRGNTTNIVNKA